VELTCGDKGKSIGKVKVKEAVMMEVIHKNSCYAKRQ